jgi:hypothetical protein
MPPFNFKAAQAEAAKDLNNKALGLLVLGQSGAGKSTLAGTFGAKTLYLYTTGESHGAKAAATKGSDSVVPVCINSQGGDILSADKAYDRLLSIINSPSEIKTEGFKAVVVDGATELETLIRDTTKWKIMCETDKGKHNTWAEGKATLAMFRPIIDGLKKLQRETNVHFVMTCILDVVSVAKDGEIVESKPRLQTYSVAEGVIQQFEDIACVGRMTKGESAAHRLQFLAGVSKESKDAEGTVMKSMNFNPRIGGVTLEKLPKTLAADLSELAKIKAG